MESTSEVRARWMQLPLRIHAVDGWYHVISRGKGGEPLLRRDQDRRAFLGLASELPERFGSEQHAFAVGQWGQSRRINNSQMKFNSARWRDRFPFMSWMAGIH